MFTVVNVVFGLVGVVVVSGGYSDPTCAPGRSVIVHLFNWKWTDVALECERYLGPNGFCGVQVSPPNEHAQVFDDFQRPWYERYQPVSYQLTSRSGNAAQFANMVSRCNAVNVRIYVDAVINHMAAATAGTGSAGSTFNPGTLQYPGVPYGPNDFNCCSCTGIGSCTTSNCSIWTSSYTQDANQVRNCRLDSLPDLKLSTAYVRQMVINYLNSLITLGVAGFRIDALKHMWPADIQLVVDQTSNLNTAIWPAGTRPFFYNEVIDMGGEVVHATEYLQMGRLWVFPYSKEIGRAFHREYTLNNLKTIGPTWSNFLPSDSSVVFVDNHDNQRDGYPILTFYDSRWYKMAQAFTLSIGYGMPVLMSSYSWPGGPNSNRGYGPPSNPDWTIQDVPINTDGTCGGGWVCEHRWRQIANMVKFRNAVCTDKVFVWWDNGYNQIAFSRGSRGFIAMNNEASVDMNVWLYTALPQGTYCDVISGNLQNGACTGKQVTVYGDSKAYFSIGSADADPTVALHIGAILSPTYTRTVVLMYYASAYGENVFIRGGIPDGRRGGCTGDASNSACALSMVHNCLGTASPQYDAYNAWKAGNTKLNWYGGQVAQGSFNGVAAQGSPALWTTNDITNPQYQAINTKGANYWLLDVMMNCAETESGWFQLKGYIYNMNTKSGYWEADQGQAGSCSGTAGGSKPYSTGNHFARCGFANVFTFGSGSCEINNL